ncbi:phospholipid carrier-dependent glycosyltransferase [Planotetraspora thailandica]|uniref:Polyprenol-phosphate-mannose--protein mannosyltransferase n=1 Tax=Planotetraspora thailandica TaxID=487172 RepID=A0A8J3XU52_9ACTN|nr:phospholipid carrier-dependent glycosyltransferase [Planotetraspora thailandica]GII52879.1 phospholipid carrier-dependent glycosyltransferase [Planotetraspora thailandica]
MAVTDFPYQAFEEPDQGPSEKPQASVRDRLVPPMPGSAVWGWIGPIVVAVFGAVLRFTRLGTPDAVVFDETYYAKDAWATVKYGVERQFVDGADKLILAGKTNVFKVCQLPEQCASFVVHPPLGKWLIGLGELAFGLNPFGWRFVTALVGALSILIIARVARRMTRSTLLGCLAGFLLSLDALHFVLSRTALLDMFVMFWVLAGFACLVVDRDRMRQRLADWYESDDPSKNLEFGPRLGLRPWRLAAGLCLGAAMASKWNGVYFIIGFALLTILWDLGARRAVGLRRPYVGAAGRDLPLAAAWMAVAPAAVYFFSFTGWFVSGKGWGRNWADATSGGPLHFVTSSLSSWLSYQTQVLSFHNGLTEGHPYQSQPWQWPLLLRPVAFFYESPKNCGAATCSWAVLGTGTPVIWFGAVIALVAMIAWYVSTRDWRAGAVLLAYGVGWLPWFYFAIVEHRTMFQFYALPLLPFMVLAIVLACGLILGPVKARPSRRITGTAIVGAYALFALINFWWLYPVIAAQIVPYDVWSSRMLFSSWI